MQRPAGTGAADGDPDVVRKPPLPGRNAGLSCSMVTKRFDKALYWACTGLLAATLTGIGLANLLRVPAIIDGLTHLGFPPYVATILGIWQVLGSAAIVAPGLPRLKEWAYAGMFFTLSGAAISHGVSGDPVAKLLVPLVLLAMVMASRALQPARLADSLRDWQTVRCTAYADQSRWS